MKNIKLMQFKDHTDKYGHLTPIEAGIDVEFDIKRIYYITRVEEGVRRGFHSHRDLEQVLLCLNGSVKILVKTPEEEEVIELNDPAQGLYIGPMIWREMYDFTEGAVLLVLASEYYTVSDYIRDYKQYEKEAIAFFQNQEDKK